MNLQSWILGAVPVGALPNPAQLRAWARGAATARLEAWEPAFIAAGGDPQDTRHECDFTRLKANEPCPVCGDSIPF